MVSPLPADAATPRARPALVLVVCFAGFVGGEIVAALASGVVAALTHYPGGLGALARARRPPWWSILTSLLGLWAGLGGAIAVAQRPGGLAAWPERWRVRWGDARYLLLGVACQGLITAIYAPFHPQSLEAPVHRLFDSSHGASLVLLGALTIAGAPLVEEWFFRGVVFRALAGALAGLGARRGVAAAVVSSAVLFALAHGEPLQFAGLAVLGVVLAYLVHRTGRLTPSLLTHVSFNAVAFTALLIQRAGR